MANERGGRPRRKQSSERGGRARPPEPERAADTPAPAHESESSPARSGGAASGGASGGSLPGSNPRRPNFTPETLDKTVIAIPLLKRLRAELRKHRRVREEGGEPPPWRQRKVVIDLNLDYAGGRLGARKRVYALIREALVHAGLPPDAPVVNQAKSDETSQYIFAQLTGPVIRALVALDAADGATARGATGGATDAAAPKDAAGDPAAGAAGRRPADGRSRRAIYRIWPDFPVRGLLTKSVSTVKADAAHSAFAAFGSGVVWAVIDSGIDVTHPHFARYDNLVLDPPLEHLDFTVQQYAPADPDAPPPVAPPVEPSQGSPLTDGYGHGTHVAGIIAGVIAKQNPKPGPDGSVQPFVAPQVVTRSRDEHGDVTYRATGVDLISGMAPQCRLLSCKVLDDKGQGDASNIIAAIERIQKINGYGRRLLIHGVNLSVGYDFEPEWFACGQSPLCVEVNRLVRSGVVVVVAAGNTGYGYTATAFRNTVGAGLPLSINDPGNADLAITVGSTHRDMPHVYGVSYFSSKGPTGDGRCKPDLVAPGEKIISCAAGTRKNEAAQKAGSACDYVEESGTSMAAPHVSGVVAAFLSVRREFIGQPERVKEIFTASATDLRRDRYFQGTGLVDLMRAIQAV